MRHSAARSLNVNSAESSAECAQSEQALEPGETLDPEQLALLIMRPKSAETASRRAGLPCCRSLFSGIYTVDNMDFVLRDAYMSGYSARAFDLDRLLSYSFFSTAGLTIHTRGVDGARAIYERASRAVSQRLFPSHGAGHRPDAQGSVHRQSRLPVSRKPARSFGGISRFTEWSLLVDVARWFESDDPRKRALGPRWREFLARQVRWKMVCQRTLVYGQADAEAASIFSEPRFVEQALRKLLPNEIANVPLVIDLARHVSRPHTRGPAAGQNFLFDPAHGKPRPLTDDQLFRQLPVSHRICRIYAEDDRYAADIAAALDRLIGPGGADDLTNM